MSREEHRFVLALGWDLDGERRLDRAADVYWGADGQVDPSRVRATQANGHRYRLFPPSGFNAGGPGAVSHELGLVAVGDYARKRLLHFAEVAIHEDGTAEVVADRDGRLTAAERARMALLREAMLRARSATDGDGKAQAEGLGFEALFAPDEHVLLLARTLRGW